MNVQTQAVLAQIKYGYNSIVTCPTSALFTSLYISRFYLSVVVLVVDIM